MHCFFIPDIPLFIWLVIFTALAFDFANGWHDTANAVATAISTRVLTPTVAIALSALFNFSGALMSTKVAKMVGGGIVNPTIISGDIGVYIIFSAMLASIIWEVYTVFNGLPVSGSHALIGGLIGASVAVFGVKVLMASGIIKIFIALLLSPILGVLLGHTILKGAYAVASLFKPIKVKIFSSIMQIFTSSAMSLMHGQNDAQKVMGVITLLLFSAGYFGTTDFKSVHVPIWVMLACACTMAAGTAIGGRAVIKTLGSRLSHLRPIEGASAELSAAVVIEGASFLGLPISTTHTITGSIVGVGVAKRVKAVKWATGLKILYAWVLTMPVVAIISAIFVRLILLIIK